MNDDVIIGRYQKQADPEKSRAILSRFKPMLKNPKHVEAIFHAVQEVYSDETWENRRLLFIASVYQSYQPLSYLQSKEDGKAAGKLPPGVRDEMARCLSFQNPEMANHFKSFTESWMKPEDNGMTRPFKVKVMAIVDRFKSLSIKPEDHQYQMFGT